MSNSLPCIPVVQEVPRLDVPVNDIELVHPPEGDKQITHVLLHLLHVHVVVEVLWNKRKGLKITILAINPKTILFCNDPRAIT